MSNAAEPVAANPVVLLDEADIAAQVQRLANEIETDHPDGVVLVGVLKGALIFLSDLARAISAIDVQIDVIAISRYAPDSGRVRILKDVDLEIAGRDVVLVEDMVDTGLTIGYLLAHLQEQRPRSLEVCTLLDRATRRIVPMPVRYVGREIGDVYVLGYGLHAADLYRNLPRVVTVDRQAVASDASVYVPTLYSAAADAGS